jgi:hypothetical protein
MRRRTLRLGLALLLAACSDDGDGSGPSTVTPGLYQGTIQLTATADGSPASASGGISIEVTADRMVAVGDSPPVPLSRDNTFATSLPSSTINGPILLCTAGTFDVTGTVGDLSISGAVAGTGVVCNDIPVEIAGTYTATFLGEFRRGAGGVDVVETLRTLIDQTVSPRR